MTTISRTESRMYNLQTINKLRSQQPPHHKLLREGCLNSTVYCKFKSGGLFSASILCGKQWIVRSEWDILSSRSSPDSTLSGVYVKHLFILHVGIHRIYVCAIKPGESLSFRKVVPVDSAPRCR